MTNPKRTAAGRFLQVTPLALLVALTIWGLAGRQAADAAATAKPAATPKTNPTRRNSNPVPRTSPLRGSGTKDNKPTGETRDDETRLSLQLDAAFKNAENSGAQKYPDTNRRLSDLKTQIGEFKSKLATLDEEELAAQFSGTGEPVGEARTLITEANNIRDEVAKLGKLELDKRGDDKGGGAESGIDWDYWLSWLVWGLASLLVIAALAAFVHFLVKLNRRVGELERRHNKVVQKLTVFEKALGEQDVFAQSVNSGLVRMREDVSREMEEVRRSYRDMRGGQRAPAAAAAAVELFPQVEREPAPDPGPSFPALVSDYLSRVSDSKKVEVISDFRTHLFVPESGGPFVLVQDEDGTGSGIVLPKARLQRGQEFAHYRGTYYCDSPSAGDVFVVEPAVVERADGGWRLRRPGRLELK